MRAAWLALALVTLACGGRALESGEVTEDADGGAGGRSTRTQGGAATAGGAFTAGGTATAGGAFTMGGAFTSGGAFTQGGGISVTRGGAQTAGGSFTSGGGFTPAGAAGEAGQGGEVGTGGGVTAGPPENMIMKYCGGGLCSYTARTCAFIQDQPTCAQRCLEETLARSPACQWEMLGMLECGMTALAAQPAACVSYPRAISACAPQPERIRNCGLSLPGAESCSSSFAGTNEACNRISRCGLVTFESLCKYDPNSGYASCFCLVNGELSVQTESFGNAEFDCALATARMGCGPVLLP